MAAEIDFTEASSPPTGTEWLLRHSSSGDVKRWYILCFFTDQVFKFAFITLKCMLELPQI
jgi:hypothetical protein